MSSVEDKLASACRFLKTIGATRNGQRAAGNWPSFSVVAGEWDMPDGGTLCVSENGTTKAVYAISNPEAKLNWARTRVSTTVYEGLRDGLKVYEVVDTVRIAVSEFLPLNDASAREAVRILDECCDELRQSLPEGM